MGKTQFFMLLPSLRFWSFWVFITCFCFVLSFFYTLLIIINNLCECLAISVHVWQSEYVREYVEYKAIFSLFFFL